MSAALSPMAPGPQTGRPRRGGGKRAAWRTRMSVLATVLSRRYSTARCCSSTSAFFSWLSLRSTSWMVPFTSGKRFTNLM